MKAAFSLKFFYSTPAADINRLTCHPEVPESEVILGQLCPSPQIQ